MNAGRASHLTALTQACFKRPRLSPTHARTSKSTRAPRGRSPPVTVPRLRLGPSGVVEERNRGLDASCASRRRSCLQASAPVPEARARRSAQARLQPWRPDRTLAELQGQPARALHRRGIPRRAGRVPAAARPVGIREASDAAQELRTHERPAGQRDAAGDGRRAVGARGTVFVFGV